MEAILFIGIQGSGKSTFFKQTFSDTHIRINLDMLKTRHREGILIDACLKAKQPFVVDNTNVDRKMRQKYIEKAREVGFSVSGYYFQSNISDCLQRNQARKAKIPEKGVISTYNKLEIPAPDEGFDRLQYVRISPDGQFTVERWKDEI